MPNQERVSWVSLVVNVIVASLYFRHILALPAGADLRYQAFYVSNLIVIAIVVAVASEIALRWVQRLSGEAANDAERLDERDALIRLKATRNAYSVLGVLVAAVLGQIAFTETGWWRSLRATREPAATVLDALLAGPLTPLLIAQLLLAAFTLTSITVYASRIYFYRRGF